MTAKIIQQNAVLLIKAQDRLPGHRIYHGLQLVQRGPEFYTNRLLPAGFNRI